VSVRTVLPYPRNQSPFRRKAPEQDGERVKGTRFVFVFKVSHFILHLSRRKETDMGFLGQNFPPPLVLAIYGTDTVTGTKHCIRPLPKKGVAEFDHMGNNRC